MAEAVAEQARDDDARATRSTEMTPSATGTGRYDDASGTIAADQPEMR